MKKKILEIYNCESSSDEDGIFWQLRPRWADTVPWLRVDEMLELREWIQEELSRYRGTDRAKILKRLCETNFPSDNGSEPGHNPPRGGLE